MIIKGLASSVPNRRIDVRDTLDMITYYSKSTPRSELDLILKQVASFCQHSGASTRSGRLANEKPIDLIADAIIRACDQANIIPHELDAVIYCSIHRGVAEPASASIVARRLGLKPKHAFDVLDACMGWCSALETCDSFFSTDKWKTALIISSEFPNEPDGAVIPGCYSISSVTELETKIAGLTMGEAAVATILSNEKSPKWEFLREEEPRHAYLCSVPLSEHNLYSDSDGDLACNGDRIFTAKARALATHGFRHSVENLSGYIQSHGAPDAIIPHSVSQVFPLKAAGKLGLSDKIYTTFPEFGNLATASVPVSLDTGVRRKHIMQKDSIAGWIGSAGMKFSAFSIHCGSTLFSG